MREFYSVGIRFENSLQPVFSRTNPLTFVPKNGCGCLQAFVDSPKCWTWLGVNNQAQLTTLYKQTCLFAGPFGIGLA